MTRWSMTRGSWLMVGLGGALALAGCATTGAPSAMVAPPALAATPPSALAEARPPVTILVSIDGFRADYLNRGITPVLSRLAAGGVSAAMRPSFPSITFPNHWTLVTGLRPDRHGIVGNAMDDPQRPTDHFTMASDDPCWWNGAEPIWATAEKAGIRTATMFWNTGAAIDSPSPASRRINCTTSQSAAVPQHSSIVPGKAGCAHFPPRGLLRSGCEWLLSVPSNPSAREEHRQTRDWCETRK